MSMEAATALYNDVKFDPHRYSREFDLRKRLQIEYAFRDISDNEKEAIRFSLLERLKLEWTSSATKKECLDSRILRNQDHNQMAYNEKVTSFFKALLKAGCQFNFQFSTEYTPCYLPMLEKGINLL